MAGAKQEFKTYMESSGGNKLLSAYMNELRSRNVVISRQWDKE